MAISSPETLPRSSSEPGVLVREGVGGSPTVYVAPVLMALGLAVVAVSDYLSRTGGRLALGVFWVGFVVVIVPGIALMVSRRTSRTERLVLLCAFGAACYGVKVLRDPLTFVMSDEFVHLDAAQQMLHSGALLPHVNLSVANVAAGYPGLQVATVALHDISALSLFVSGLIVIGIARLILMLALFHLFERISGSSRMAGLGALLFAVNSNFFFWSTQFSYESLSLPLFCVVLYLLASRSERIRVGAASLAAGLLIVVIAATHHVTSYALAVYLWVTSLMAVLAPRWRSSQAFALAVLATGLGAAWFFLIAPGTRYYLGYVFGTALRAVTGVTSQKTVHTPFGSAAGGLETPLPEEGVSFIAVALIGIGVLWALRHARRLRLLSTPSGCLFSAAAVGCLALYPLRLLPGAWETTNRAQEFLFIGVAFTLGALISSFRIERLRPPVAQALLVLGITILIAGGVIEGWPSPLLLSQPLEVKVGRATIVPQGLSAARWGLRNLSASSVYVGDEATGRWLATGGARYTYFGAQGSIYSLVLQSNTFPSWQQQLLRRDRVDYLVADRRRIANNDQSAYFFQPASNPSGGLGYFPAAASRKFAEVPNVSKVFDSGDISIYDVRSLRSPRPSCANVGVASEGGGLACVNAAGRVQVTPAEGTVTLPGVRVRYLGGSVQKRKNGVFVTVLLVVENRSDMTLPERGRLSPTLIVDGRRFKLFTGRTGRHDGLTPFRTVARGSQRVGSLTFVIRHTPLSRAVLGGKARVAMPAATPGTTPYTAVLPVTAPKSLP